MSHPHAAEVSADQIDDWSPHAPETFHELDRIGKAAAVLLGLATFTHLLSTWSDWHTYGVVNKYLGGVPNVEDADLNKADAIARLTSIPNVVISVAAAVVFVLWLWRARLNSEVFCQGDHRHSHGWVLTSWFCPGANLFYPHHIVTDVWAASNPNTPVWADDLRRYRRAPIIGAWWVCWLGAMILDVVVRRVLMWIDPTVPVLRLIAISATVSVILTASSAGLAAVIIRRITWMQTSRPWIPWWDHREESRSSSRPASRPSESLEAFPYAEAQRGEPSYADSPYAAVPSGGDPQTSEWRPGFDQPLAEPLVAVAPAYQANREPQLVNTARLDLTASPLAESRWSDQTDWSQPQPVNWSEPPHRPEPAGPSWSETRPTPTPSDIGPMNLPPAETRPMPPAETRPMNLPPAENRPMGMGPVDNRPMGMEPIENRPMGIGPVEPPAADPFDRPWMQQAAGRPEPMPQPAPEPQPPAPAPAPTSAEDESQSWSPFTALVESWRQQAEAEEAAESRWSDSTASADAPGRLQSPGYLEPPSSYLEPSGFVAPAPEPVHPPATHHDPLHDPIAPSWQPQPQPQPRWSESTWSEPQASEPQWSEPAPEPQWSEPAPEPQWSEPAPEPQWSESAPEPHWSESSWTETPWSEPLPQGPEMPAAQWSEPDRSEQPYFEAQRPEPSSWSTQSQPPSQPEWSSPAGPTQPELSRRPAPPRPEWSAEPPPSSPPRLSVVPPLPAPEPGIGPQPVADPATYAGSSEPWQNTGSHRSESPDLLAPSAPIPKPDPAPTPPRHLARPRVEETPPAQSANSYLAQAPVVPGPPPAIQPPFDQTANQPGPPATGTPPAPPRARPANTPTPVNPAPQPPRKPQPSAQPSAQPPRTAQPGGTVPRTHPHRRRWAAGPG